MSGGGFGDGGRRSGARPGCRRQAGARCAGVRSRCPVNDDQAERHALERVKVTWEIELIGWAENNIRRDELVRSAVNAGVTKHRVHVLTGIARTTIDRIINLIAVEEEA